LKQASKFRIKSEMTIWHFSNQNSGSKEIRTCIEKEWTYAMVWT